MTPPIKLIFFLVINSLKGYIRVMSLIKLISSCPFLSHLPDGFTLSCSFGEFQVAWKDQARAGL